MQPNLRTNGQFLLRIEDTDQKRLVRDAEERLCQELQWAGLNWDEGPQVGGQYGPYKQSERNDIYQKHAKELLNSGSAYRCFCTPKSTGSTGATAAYVTSACYQDCSSLAAGEAQEKAESKHEAFTVRLNQPSDAHKRVYKDLIYGKIQRLKRSPSASPGGEDDSGIDAADTVLIKSDGTPTYHFANVVDDHLMKITHVIRGTEWMASTPLHYDLYSAFGWDPPAFAHVGLLVDENKAKLSKRSNTGLVLDVKGMREQNGILPAVLCNFLALLGWSNPGRNDVLEMQDLIKTFDLKFTKGNTIVRTEKLWYLQKQHVAREVEKLRPHDSKDTRTIQDITSRIREELHITSTSEVQGASIAVYLRDVLLADSKSYSTPKQYAERNRYFFKFDESQVPADREYYDKQGSVTAQYLLDICRNDILKCWEGLPDHIWPFSEASNHDSDNQPYSEHIATLDDRASCLHDHIENALWREVYPGWDEWSPNRRSDMTQSPELQELERQKFKALNGAMNRFLRDKLAYGLPGPSVAHIMALLGWSECLRRLGLTEHNPEKWVPRKLDEGDIRTAPVRMSWLKT
ncbi:uncharacterized protein MYCFIDRAFT_213977 [Pseudocercospora fijiensis CIRAD86]|uniref:Glutamyl/glutaminyl-tRNA synthetase class Ib catalytic domain-containing protein n=1 Tax=Pseudocercospora fijiensis (strain CIRAD86) TaxID=383855 RepID=M2Z7K2_PSEFD|nr:uncharacterized protein MYCFIDRAFT_213977 [Pseudocercospora fijiensis CIRAD86]EME85740.1 hypothetical protein MYCFIDRAFT_213977 [Pseudocercospora fijiensis CIRAD86]